MSKVNIAAQALAIERAYVSIRGHRDVISGLVLKGKRPPHELKALDDWLEHLRPAVATMKWLQLNEEDIKAALTRPAA